MKTITVKNPDQDLIEIMKSNGPVRSEWVQTCHNSSCGCVSHDPGYYNVTGIVDDEIGTEEVGASVYSHPTTIIVKS